METEPVSGVPDGRAPKPVGMAIQWGRRKPAYYHWGHKADTANCDEHWAGCLLMQAISESDTLICFNIGFDTEVVRQHMGIDLSTIAWHDVQVMAFHENPHALQLGLKPIARDVLDMPPDEMDDVRAWLREHKLIRSNQKEIGAFLHLAPGDVVAPYAIGDIVRTRRLFDRWAPRYLRGERAAGYTRDMKATRVGIKMTQRGVPIDRVELARSLNKAEAVLDTANKRVASILGLTTFDPNDRQTNAEAIERKIGIELPRTTSGKISTSKDTLKEHLPDGELKALLRYITAVTYDLQNYLRPWTAATRIQSTIHPHWSVTRSDSGGARTGRLSSSPNFQNLRGEEGTQVLRESLTKMFARDYWTPQIRGCVAAPSRDFVIVGRDWSQIELRLTAHYEDGPMAEHYREDPDWDLHQWVMDRVKELFDVLLQRRIAKNIGFGSIYGGGSGAIAGQAGITIGEAAEFISMYFQALPSLKALMREVMETSRVRPIQTLGGRFYAAEPPRFDPREGRMLEFFYKMLNYLIQGSAADLMKEAMIDADAYGLPLILSVHDEPVVLARRDDAEDTLEALRVAMEHNDLISNISVPIISDGYIVSRWSDADQAKKLYEGM